MGRLSKRIGPHGALISVLSAGIFLIAGLTLAAAQVYDNVVDNDGVAGLDRPLLDLSISLRLPWSENLVTGFTEVAGTIGMPLIAISAILTFSIHRRSWTPAILILAAGGGSLAMTIAGKNYFDRVRPALIEAVPPYEYSPSFPSGHTLNAVAVIGVIAYLLVLRQKTTGARAFTSALAVAFATTIGLSRVYLGHHWFTDVLAAWILGSAWLAFVVTAHRLYLMSRANRAVDVYPTTSST